MSGMGMRYYDMNLTHTLANLFQIGLVTWLNLVCTFWYGKECVCMCMCVCMGGGGISSGCC